MTMTNNNPSRFSGAYSQHGNAVGLEEVATASQRDRLDHVASQQMPESDSPPFSQSTAQPTYQHSPYSAQTAHRAQWSSEQTHSPVTQSAYSPVRQQHPQPVSQTTYRQPQSQVTRPAPQRMDSPGQQTQLAFQEARRTAPSSVFPPRQTAPSFTRPGPQCAESPVRQQSQSAPSVASPARQTRPSFSRPDLQSTHSPVHQQPQSISHTHPPVPQHSHQSSWPRQSIPQSSHPQVSRSSYTASPAGHTASPVNRPAPQPMLSPVRQSSHRQGHQPQQAQGAPHSAPYSTSPPAQSAPSFNQSVSQRVRSPACYPAPVPIVQPMHQRIHQPAQPANAGDQAHLPPEAAADAFQRPPEPATISPVLLQKVPMPTPAPVSQAPQPPSQQSQQNNQHCQDHPDQQVRSGHLNHATKKRRLENKTSETRPQPQPKHGKMADLSVYKYTSPHRTSLWSQPDMADAFDETEAAEKVIYDPSTIARDVLIAAGHHSTEPGLNYHLQGLRSLFTSVTPNSDLETFRWHVVEAHARAQPPLPKPQTVKPHIPQPPPQPQTVQPHVYQPPPSVPQPQPQPQPPTAFRDPVPPAIHSQPLPQAKAQTFPRQDSLVDSAKHSLAVNPKQSPAAHPPSRSPAASSPKQSPAVELTEQSPASLPKQSVDAPTQTLAVEPSKQPPAVVPPKQSPDINLPKQTPVITLPKRGRGRPQLQVEVPAPSKESRMVGKRSVRIPAQLKVEVRVPYPVFACKWKNCQAELHNLAVLVKHILKVHIPFHVRCEWAKCASEETLAAASLFDHVKTQHVDPIAWKLGDGPSVPTAEGSETSASPGPLTRPDPNQAGGEDSLIFPASYSSIRAFNRVHKKNSPREKANEVLKAVQRLKERIGVGLDPGGCELATPERNQRVSNDEGVYEVIGTN